MNNYEMMDVINEAVARIAASTGQSEELIAKYYKRVVWAIAKL